MDPVKKYKLSINNMSCSSCVSKIESSLKKLPYVEKASINFAKKIIYIESSVNHVQIISYLSSIGYDATRVVDGENIITQYNSMFFITKIILPGLLGLFLFFYTMYCGVILSVGSVNLMLLFILLVTSIILYISAGKIYKSAYKSLRRLDFNMDTLISLGTLSAYVYSFLVIVFPAIFPIDSRHIYLEASVMIICLINLGSYIETKARAKTSDALEHLIGLQPTTVFLIDDNNIEQEISIDLVKEGDILRVRPGEIIGLDGVINSGKSYVDESMLNGESNPIYKEKKSKVYSGTINNGGSFTYIVRKTVGYTILSKIIDLVQNAQNSKPPIVHIVDKISSIFVPLIIFISIFTAIIWYTLGFPVGVILLTSISTLVIACPCALGLATPISIIIAMGKAAKNGIFIKNGKALQNASKIDHIVFDKTGTITKGKPEVNFIKSLNANFSEKMILEYAASIEFYSEHPLARAIIKYSASHSLSLLRVDNFENQVSQGVTGSINDQYIVIGSRSILENKDIMLDSVSNLIQTYQNQGHTIVYMLINNELAGIISISDQIKPESIEVIRDLQSKKINVSMLTGDDNHTAYAIAHKVGISNVVANCLPTTKLDYITKLQNNKVVVGMVGDGINDAPALMKADIGFAIGEGTDIAIESSDITLMNSSLFGIISTIEIAKLSVKNIKQNLFGAFIYNVIGIPIAAGLLYPIFGIFLSPIISAIAMACSSITVVLNANRLRYIQVRNTKNV